MTTSTSLFIANIYGTTRDVILFVGKIVEGWANSILRQKASTLQFESCYFQRLDPRDIYWLFTLLVMGAIQLSGQVISGLVGS